MVVVLFEMMMLFGRGCDDVRDGGGAIWNNDVIREMMMIILFEIRMLFGRDGVNVVCDIIMLFEME